MKKFSILGLVVFLLLASLVIAQPIKRFVPNQATLAWNAVTTLNDGNPIPVGDIVSYEVFITAYPINEPDRHDPAAHQSLGTGSSTNMLVTFSQEGEYLLGVRTLRLVGGDPIQTVYSETISWSDMNGIITLDPFYVAFFLPPAAPEGLILQ